MRKLILLCFSLMFLLSGCTKVSYSNEFVGIPIYPGTELISSNELGNRVIETYIGMPFKGDIEKVKEFFEKNIDESIWSVEIFDGPEIGHNVDKIYNYTLRSKERSVGLTIAYSKGGKVDAHINITIIGDKQK